MLMLGIFIARNQETNVVLKDNNTATKPHQQRTIKTFFSSSTTPHATSQPRSTQVEPRPQHSKGLTID